MDLESLRKLADLKAAEKQHKKALDRVANHEASDSRDIQDHTPRVATAVTLSHIRRRASDVRFINAQLTALNEQAEALKNGDMSALEEMLLGQAVTLNSLFHFSVGLASEVMAGGSSDALQAAESLISIGGKAAEQSRKAIATLAEIKHPKRATFIRKQNNLVVAPAAPDQTLQLREAYGGEIVDGRTAAAAAGTDIDMEAVAAVNGTENPKRQSKKRSKQS